MAEGTAKTTNLKQSKSLTLLSLLSEFICVLAFRW